MPLQTRGGRNVVLYFHISNLVCDGDALRMLMNWKGASGKLACFQCLNVVNVPPSSVLPDGCVRLSCYDKARFNPASNQDWWNKADSLLYEKDRLGKGRFEKLETATGLTLNPRGLLWDHALRPYIGPIDICTKDAMHTMLVDGVGHSEMRCVLGRLAELGDDWVALNQVMQANWKFCRLNRSGGQAIRRSFNRKREVRFKGQGLFAPDAGELLAIFPLFGHYLNTVALAKHGESIRAAVDSFHACACCIALAKEGKFDGAHAQRLDRAMVTHAEKKSIAYPNDGHRAKDHWRFHLGDQMVRDGLILDCFAGERVNRAFKRCAEEMKPSTDTTDLSYEASVMKRTMVHFDDMWERGGLRNELRSPVH